MSRPLRLPPPETPLQLYRHLLRESSYLPSVVRPFVDKYIKSSFQKSQKDISLQHVPSRFKRGQQSLRYLRAANNGDISRMNRILLMAFGRIGPRRRQLVSSLVRKPIPTDTAELAAYVQQYTDVTSLDRDPDWLDNWDTNKLYALARSQMSTSPRNSPRPDITAANLSHKLTIPEKNSWDNPWPKKTYRTKLKKFWITLVEKIMPPLPKDEWEKLALLAQGQFQEAGWYVPPRRTPVGTLYEPEWRYDLYATQPVARVDRRSSRRQKLLTGALDDNTPTGDPQPLNCHRFTPRLWRRLLMHIWSLSPTMEKTDVAGKGGGSAVWSVKWGKQHFTPPAATKTGEMEFFGGIAQDEAKAKGDGAKGKKGKG